MSEIFHQLFDPESSAFTYLVGSAGEAALIDGVHEQLERDLRLAESLSLRIVYAIETHLHSDHRSSAAQVHRRTGALLCASGRGPPAAQRILTHGTQLRLGTLTLDVLETPGHTEDAICLRVGDRVLTGDTLLVHTTGRCDLLGGDPGALYDSIINMLFTLPDPTLVCPGHDYAGATVSTIGEEKRLNARLVSRSREEFIAFEQGLVRPPTQENRRGIAAQSALGRMRFHVNSGAP